MVAQNTFGNLEGNTSRNGNHKLYLETLKVNENTSGNGNHKMHLQTKFWESEGFYWQEDKSVVPVVWSQSLNRCF